MTQEPAPQDPPARRRDPEGRRRAIVHAATELVIENGAAALTHRAIATRAGVPLGSTTQHFASIDELREIALQQIADEIDESLAQIDPHLANIRTHPERAVDEFVEFLHDQRAVRCDLALTTTGTTDPRLRPLALRWTDRLIDRLSEQVGRECATAVAVFLDGVMIHAGLHDTPLGRDELTRVLSTLLTLAEASDSSLSERP